MLLSVFVCWVGFGFLRSILDKGAGETFFGDMSFQAEAFNVQASDLVKLVRTAISIFIIIAAA